LTPNRIFVVTEPTPLCAAVHEAATGEPDLEVIDVPGGEIELLLRVAEEAVDLVVIAMTARTLPPLAERLLDEYPRLPVLAVDLERAEGLLHLLKPDTTLIHHLAVAGLAAVIRGAASDRPL
jgi:hypothetical protein